MRPWRISENRKRDFDLSQQQRLLKDSVDGRLKASITPVDRRQKDVSVVRFKLLVTTRQPAECRESSGRSS
ncbi:hypothetical protein OO17_02395 [Rhodopseudomonas palustris]|uniref:Uncharacterized protein n=1 Tax=Rhodopseudomonas palustris TaxID=1076 RepID=A0A0D7F7W2_RHOPL|nr:hypothetical protein OO17_02395 [Rhodopseudomonas palustris]